MRQNYHHYTAEAQQIWKDLFSRQFQNLSQRAVSTFLSSTIKVNEVLNEDAIPHFSTLNNYLATATNWQIEVVSGLIPVKDFFLLLSKRKFPASTWLRSRQQFDYLEEPDMFHDVFGHVPLLFQPAYADFMQQIGILGLQMQYSERWTAILERYYWFTVEFGLCMENNQKKILGAGILSSYGETNQLFTSDAIHCKPFDLSMIVNHTFYKHEMQNIYYVLPSFQSLFDSLNQLKEMIQRELVQKVKNN